ncbi:hypothetical protein P7K49_023426 [Saguinus oedipus]|uniref:Uncharacterized protein n=1 Tax=Saguinus oedipus TaxID=9490 RepID=A0ABQ9UMF7_SAGOE|nr:hypothetical protein P7K49_023426 [Saguinus oedipus]
MEVMTPMPALCIPRAQRDLVVSLAPTMSQPFSLIKQQVKLRSHLQYFKQKRLNYLSILHVHMWVVSTTL